MTFKGNTIFVVAIVIMNAQIFSANASNPLGIKGVQESFYVFLTLWAFVSISSKQLYRSKVPDVDMFVFLTPLVLTAYGAVAAYSTFGQPPILGILEERRVFALYAYFPFIDCLRAGRIKLEVLESILVNVMILSAILMIGVSFDLIPTWNEIRRSEVALRSERIAIGATFIAAFLPVVLRRLSHAGSMKRTTIFIFLAFSLVFVVQSRQLLIALTLSIISVLRAHVILATAILLLVLVLIFFHLLPAYFGVYYQLFAQLGSDQYLNESWRALGIGEVLSRLRAGGVWGHGSLSPFWQGGFQNEIGPFFFLADIGAFGTIYRYGIFGLFWYGLYLAIQLKYLKRIHERSAQRAYIGVFIFLIVLLPVAAPLEYRGFIAGPLLAISVYLGLEPKIFFSRLRERSGESRFGKQSIAS